ncbi:uncharacterized protein L3040_008348 [Drepanopeziza brunnea f. sp. 'multigermtubi']|uniref:Uncharacterized protein n=1 Tax=Marssonina brunnea f. sp. multigermtubi (strain MB_m1) TaxID=1072389 RepID=K1WN37_MARBU|nr:uncharacterized protein MBM_07531 [Drepanopeziza brunnea f. sp. 'multigermtubi' MB_m1]EKD14301.1 hypothetical protein MBM_07531 [Drepanopeziza brunnea f. sp. 'multigermtubi' MB_m1]KAJ5035087.1 hypothetical protein L3040_008348 [Drepanopeziza brunnea f. sp. 'multigermtubi']
MASNPFQVPGSEFEFSFSAFGGPSNPFNGSTPVPPPAPLAPAMSAPPSEADGLRDIIRAGNQAVAALNGEIEELKRALLLEEKKRTAEVRAKDKQRVEEVAVVEKEWQENVEDYNRLCDEYQEFRDEAEKEIEELRRQSLASIPAGNVLVDDRGCAAATGNSSASTSSVSNQDVATQSASPVYRSIGTYVDFGANMAEHAPVPVLGENLQNVYDKLNGEHEKVKALYKKCAINLQNREKDVVRLEGFVDEANKATVAEKEKATKYEAELAAIKKALDDREDHIEYIEKQLGEEQEQVTELQTLARNHTLVVDKLREMEKDVKHYKDKEAEISRNSRNVYAQRDRLEKELEKLRKAEGDWKRERGEAARLEEELKHSQELLESAYAQIEKFDTETAGFQAMPESHTAPVTTESLNRRLSKSLSHLSETAEPRSQPEEEAGEEAGEEASDRRFSEEMRYESDFDSGDESEETEFVPPPVPAHDDDAVLDDQGRQIIRVDGPAAETRVVEVPIHVPEIQIEYRDPVPAPPAEPTIIRVPARIITTTRYVHWFTTELHMLLFLWAFLTNVFNSSFSRSIRGVATVSPEVVAGGEPGQDGLAPAVGAGAPPAPPAVETEGFRTLRQPVSFWWTLFWFLMHCIAYYFCWVAFDTYSERKIWRAANEATRAMLTNWLNYRYPDQGILHALLSPEWAAWVDRGVVNTVRYALHVEYTPYPMPG